MGAIVPSLTPAQIAHLRCEPAVELVARDRWPPWPKRPDERPYMKVHLGIAIRPVGEEEAGGRLPGGLAVTSVGPESVASKAGLLAKDCILQFDGHDINSMQDLWNLMVAKNPGDAVLMAVLRDGHEMSVVVQF
jgi:S1-C subfamily serine protease